jgi:hypothetical protein
MNIKWFDRITNEDLWSITQQETIENQIKRRKWNWIGRTLRKERGEIEKTALDWNHQGYRRRGRPKRTWRRTIEDEIRVTRKSWMSYAPQGVKGSDHDDDKTAAVRSKAKVCSRSNAGIVCSNPADSMDVWLFLSAFRRTATISYIMSVRPSAHMEQLGSHRAHFREI